MGNLASERDFVGQLVEMGYSHDQIREELESMGWHPRSADQVLERFEKNQISEVGEDHAGPDLSRFPSCVQVEDRKINLLATMRSPRLSLFGNFMSEEECAELIALSLPHMQRSEVVISDGVARRETTQAYARTSDQVSLPRGTSELVDALWRRAAQLTRWPETYMQDLFVIRYRPGADFSPHNDYFPPDSHPELARDRQRVATLLLYLSSASYGGATAFLDVEVEIHPQAGNALLFSYPRPCQESLTLHAGVPLCEGEKWIATFFLSNAPVKSARTTGMEV
ncbi:prolyl hydroxylase family protein [[Pseudomonas] boreopolis]|uniref:prolyl hydroxylase family protein n=1 Tax=Xanthomonas boreopolis TaxID=86183 RepID=UPI003D9B28B3